MSTPRHLLAVAVATLVVLTGCGQDDTATAPPARPAPAATPGAAAGATPVNCVATWTQGNTGSFTCQASGPNRDRVKISADTLQLDKICVSDERLTTYTFGGTQTAPINATGTPPQRCETLGALRRLPEKCTCVPPAGGNCDSPAGGKFICLVIGHVG